MSSEAVIEAGGLGKAYQIYKSPQDRLKQMLFRNRRFFTEYWAVQNVDLRIGRGETVGIVGRNGSGKSTLLQMIAGTLHPNSGTLRVEGRVAPLLELGAGFNPEFTGRENVRLSAAILGLSNGQIEEREPAILEFAGIGDFVDQPVKTYSSGMYARLAFAVAAHVDADILIVDEILAVGDAAFTQKCMRFIHRFKEHGTILFVSHDTGSVNALCDRAIWMEGGQVRAEGKAKDISLAYQAALHGEADGKSFSLTGRRRETPRQRQDVRHEAISNSTKRNEIEVFEFDPDAPSYGAGGGRIVKVSVESPSGATSVLEGGHEVALRITAETSSPLYGPIIGFFVRDRLGQNLFGDNTFISYAHTPLDAQPGEQFEAVFRFQLPYLPEGDYSVAVALAAGSQSDHVQHHWIDDALTFRAVGGAHEKGLLGIPMHAIELTKY
ncbi:ABC transporter ATP-binding protein [Pelagibacterium luteolum]|uniref:Lipopolysaccharide transport system ATP-binding protein n=1 Tax=Pelagibacterium luteolum TaxID=440168 RepID=A0A1G7XW42_9HYPH|nr:ABC transporter ATP-binding protein [Pelagibacterium luteolum]SDG88371.1 lipopolysaccharide transport system ATP-binding protein [Pelagibacterium luteolum]